MLCDWVGADSSTSCLWVYVAARHPQACHKVLRGCNAQHAAEASTAACDGYWYWLTVKKVPLSYGLVQPNFEVQQHQTTLQIMAT